MENKHIDKKVLYKIISEYERLETITEIILLAKNGNIRRIILK